MDEVQLGAQRAVKVPKESAFSIVQLVRLEALKLALVGPHQNQQPPQVLERAAAFADYLQNGETSTPKKGETHAYFSQE